MSDDVQPWLTALASPTRPLGAALPAQPNAVATSPWGPQPAIGQDPATLRELDRLKAAAIEEGRAQGRRETEELRKKLASAIEALDRQRTANVTKASELIADAAIAVIEAWLDAELDRKDRFQPIVRGWLQRTGDGAGAVAKCNPADVAAMREAVGEALISIEPDPAVPPSSVRIANATLEIDHDWTARLGELRQAIATAADGADR